MQGPFRYALLEACPSTVFNHPMALRKLALFFADSYLYEKKQPKPFLVAVLNATKGTYTLCAVADTAIAKNGHLAKK